MRRARREVTRIGFDLFPFLSILSCVLGSLLLVVMAVVALCVGVTPEIWEIEGYQSKRPAVLEWDGASVVLHPGRVRVAAGAALQNQGVNNSPFGLLLREVEADKGRRYVFVAVRPSGFASFSSLRTAVIKRGIDIGSAPLDQYRPFELSEAR
jgi:hypothetical protein